MTRTPTRSRKRSVTSSPGGRLTRLLAHQPPETLAQIEALVRSRKGARSGGGIRSPFNLTIQEITLLNSFRQLPDEASREAVVRGVGAYQRFASNSRQAAVLRRAEGVCAKVRRAAR